MARMSQWVRDLPRSPQCGHSGNFKRVHHEVTMDGIADVHECEECGARYAAVRPTFHKTPPEIEYRGDE